MVLFRIDSLPLLTTPEGVPIEQSTLGKSGRPKRSLSSGRGDGTRPERTRKTGTTGNLSPLRTTRLKRNLTLVFHLGSSGGGLSVESSGGSRGRSRSVGSVPPEDATPQAAEDVRSGRLTKPTKGDSTVLKPRSSSRSKSPPQVRPSPSTTPSFLMLTFFF
jgi:hypothetical protein